MRGMFCKVICGLGAVLLFIALALKNLLLQLILLFVCCWLLYVVMRFVRWLVLQVAPILRVLIVVAGVGGLVLMTWNDLQSLGGEKLFVISILLFIICGVMCAPGTSRVRA